MEFQNRQAEDSILGSILVDPDCIYKIIDTISPKDFSSESNGLIFAIMVDFSKKSTPIDPITISSELKKRKVNIEEKRLGELLLAVVSSCNIEEHAKIVKDLSVIRKIGKVGDDISRFLRKPDATAEVGVALLNKSLEDVTLNQDEKGFVNISKVILDCYDELDKKSKSPKLDGIMTGFQSIDKILHGFKPGEMIVLAARPSMGKTSLAISIATNIARMSKNVGVLSLEMSKEQITKRIISAALQVEMERIEKGDMTKDDLLKLSHMLAAYEKRNFFIDDKSSDSIFDLKNKMKKMAFKKTPIDFVVIDYLQLLSSSKYQGNKVQEIGEISRNVKMLAMEFNVPILVLSQLSRAVESRQDKHPVLSDLRDSGSIEQDADVVMMLYRDDYYKKTRTGKAEVSIIKNRNGAVGDAILNFDASRTAFYN